MKLNKWLLAGMMAGALIAAGCSDDSDDNGNSGESGDSGDSITVVDTPNWIGAPCSCESTGSEECDMFGVPLPKPQGDGKIVGCDNVDAASIDGGAQVCLRTIEGEGAKVAPATYFPQGYCSISAIGCEGGKICSMVAYGDAGKMTSCPAGSTLLESKFPFKILVSNVVITNKTCAKNCKTDADCNVDGGMTCMTKGNARFCYNQKNFDGTTTEYTATPF